MTEGPLGREVLEETRDRAGERDRVMRAAGVTGPDAPLFSFDGHSCVQLADEAGAVRMSGAR